MNKKMTTQVIFKIDKNLKAKAMKRAQSEGLPFAAVLKLATKAYVEGSLSVDLTSKEEFNPKTRREIEKALRDIKEGKNLSPGFTTAKEAIAYLRNIK